MSCYEKNPEESPMKKTVEDYQKEIKSIQNELECWKKNGEVKSDVVKRQQDILDKTLLDLPVGYIPNHTYENIPSRVEYYVEAHSILEKESEAKDELIEKLRTEKAKAVNDHLLLQVYAEEDAKTLQSLEKAIKTHYDYYKGFAAKKHLSSIEMLDTLFSLCNHVDTKENEHPVNDNRKLHGELAKCIKDSENIENECNRYKAALEEIVKRPRKSDTCKLIAQQALGLLSDDDYQPELLIEENLALKIKIEDLQAVIDSELLDKVFPNKVNPYIALKDCGEYWDYHHEQHCKAHL
jgi:hypothetical protein